jgi:hypothetical protein
LSTRRFAFLDRHLFAALAFAALAVTLAYQVRLPFSLAIGGPIDRPLLVWIHDPEVDKAADTRFRWTSGGSELFIRDWGAGNPIELRVRVTRWHPNDGIANLTLYVNGEEFAEPQASGQGWQEYTLPITDRKFLAVDDLHVKFESDTFIPKQEVPGSQDPRRLGIQLSSISLIPLQYENGKWRPSDGLVWSPSLPPYDLAFYFVASALALYLGVAAFKFPRLYALIVSLLFSVCAAITLVWLRPYITLFADTFLLIVVVSILLGLLVRVIVPRFFSWGGVHASDWEINVLSLVFAFAFLIKIAMLLYPQTISFDLLYHVHRLAGVMGGNLFWSIPSGKNEFGGQAVPYSPSFYLFLAPFVEFVSPTLLVQLSGVLLDTISIFFIYYLARKYLYDLDIQTSQTLGGQIGDRPSGRAGIFAAWIYVIAPLAFIALSWGIYANIFGQTLTLLLIVTLIEAFDKLTRPKAFFVAALLFTLTLLSHSSVFVSVVFLFAAWIALIFALGRMWRARPFWALIGSILLASIIAFVVYYSEFLGLVREGTQQIASAAADPITRNISGETLTFLQLLQPARTPYNAVPLYVYAAALAGFAIMLYRTRNSPTRGRFLLATMLIAWFAAFALLIMVRAEFGFSARYVNFAMPAIALCAGAALAWVYARGVLGRVISLGLILLLTAQGLYHWYILVMYQYH